MHDSPKKLYTFLVNGHPILTNNLTTHEITNINFLLFMRGSLEVKQKDILRRLDQCKSIIEYTEDFHIVNTLIAKELEIKRITEQANTLKSKYN